jgi:glycosyltransferase involved in cell wall biosynthesis
MSRTSLLLSLVVPVHNEEANLRRLHGAVVSALRSVDGVSWEFIFIDDGSSDKSFEILQELHAADPSVRVLRFPRNFGSHVAIAAGLDYCRGDAAVIMAADLQDPPDLLPSFIAQWQAGYEIVWGARQGRDDGFLRSRLMRLFYRLVRRFAIPTYPAEGTGSFCLIGRAVVETFRECKERNRLTFGLIAWSGFPQTQVLYHRPARTAGQSSWTTGRLVKSAVDTFAAFSFAPIRTISYFGLCVSLLSFLVGFYLLVNKFVYGTQVEGWTSVMVAVLVLGGVQLTMIGVLGEYLWRVAEEARARPLYILERRLGFEGTSADSEHAAGNVPHSRAIGRAR